MLEFCDVIQLQPMHPRQQSSEVSGYGCCKVDCRRLARWHRESSQLTWRTGHSDPECAPSAPMCGCCHRWCRQSCDDAAGSNRGTQISAMCLGPWRPTFAPFPSTRSYLGWSRVVLCSTLAHGCSSVACTRRIAKAYLRVPHSTLLICTKFWAARRCTSTGPS